MENNNKISTQEQTNINDILNEGKMNLTDRVILITPEAVKLVAEKLFALAKESAMNELSGKTETISDESPLITQSQAVEMLGKCKNTLWKWRKSGYLKSITVGGEVKYKLSDIQKILNGRGGQ